MGSGVVTRFIGSSRTLLFAALAPPVAAYVIAWGIWPFIAPFAWSLFYPAVLVSARFGGSRAAHIATPLSAVMVVYAFMEPYQSFSLRHPAQFISTAIFCCTGIAIGRGMDRVRGVLRANKSALERSEARFQSMFDSMLEGCQVIDPDFRYRYVNASVLVHAKRARNELIGQRMTDVYPGIEETEMFALLKRCMEERVPQRMFNHFAYEDGSIGCFDLSIQPAPEGVFVLSVDMSEQKQAEAKLFANELLYRQIVESVHEGIWQIDQAGITTYVNRHMAEMLGYGVDEMLGAPFLQFMSESEKERALANMERRRVGIAEQHDFMFQRKDGRQLWTLVSTNPLRDPEGHFVGALALVTDLTLRMQTEAALREGDAQFRHLAESLPQLIWTSKADGSVDFFSQQWQSYTGIAADELRRLGWFQCVHPDRRSELSEDWQRAIATGEEFHREIQLRQYDGVYRWFELRAVPRRDADAKIVRWVGANSDIDDRKRGETLRLHAQKMEALGTLAGGIAHDFNNVLMAIQGNAALAIADVRPGNPLHDRLSEIERAGTRAKDLVRRILTFSRQEEPKRECVLLFPVMREAFSLLRASLPAKIALRTRFNEHAPAVTADSTQILQVLMNLATNAAHAIGKEAGVIELGLDVVDVDSELARSTPGLLVGRYVCVSVSDNGCGMSETTLARMYDPFFTTKPVGQGTGLGLSMVDGIVKSHGGALRVTSQLGQGAHFRLYLPAVDGYTRPPSVATPEEPVVAGECVLYVDDDPAVVLLAVHGLKALGFEVTGCADPEDAMRLFEADPDRFAAVVTDYAMPHITGIELSRALLVLRADLPIVLISGFLGPDEQRAALASGVRIVLHKPTSLKDLARALHKVIHAPA